MTVSNEAVLLQQLINELLNKCEPGDQLHALIDCVDVLPAGGTAGDSGNNTLITPASGKTLQLYYVSYNPQAAVTAAFRWGEAGNLWLKNTVPAKSVIAKDWGASRHFDGGVDQPLILNLSGAASVNWNVFYTEV